jgi:hypothetical protein
MIDRIRRRSATYGRQGLVRIFGAGAAGHVWRVQVAPVAPVDEAEQKPGAEHELAKLKCGGHHLRSSTVAADGRETHPRRLREAAWPPAS